MRSSHFRGPRRPFAATWPARRNPRPPHQERDHMRRDLYPVMSAVIAGALAMVSSEGVSGAKAAGAEAKVAVEKVKWGEADGKEVDLYTLTNRNGLVAKITNYGAIVVELHVPDKTGQMGDIALGYENLADYIKKTPYFGATVGRVGNRIANAQFELEGKTYKLAANNAPSHLHGGKKGWDKVVWDAEASETPKGPALKLTYVSKDGEEGYPGTVTAITTYTLT